jgi:cytochrome c-type biogenesis protein
VSVGSLVASGPLILAMPVAAAAGAVTFLSPCCLPLVPGYLSYVTGMSGMGVQPAAAAAEPAGVAARSATAGAGTAGAGAGTARAGAGTAEGGAGTARAGTGTAEGGAGTAGAGAGTAGAGAGTAGAGARAAGAGAGTARTPAAPAATVPAPRRSRVVAGTALFVLGFSVLFTLYGALFGGAGHALLSHQEGLTQLLGAVTIVLGLLFAGLLDRFALAGRMLRPSVRPRAGLVGAPLLGVLFGLGWTPCIGPTLAAVLTLAETSATATRGAFLAFIYCLGLGVPFLLVAVAFQRGVRAFGFARRHARLVTAVGGGMLVLVGLLEVTGAWTAATHWMQHHWIQGYNAPL